MDAVGLSALLALGLLLVVDALVRPGARREAAGLLRRAAPRAVGAAAAALVALAATGWPVAGAAGALVGASVPGAMRRARRERERLERREALAEVASRLRDAIRSGIGLADALTHAAESAPRAIRTDLRRLVSEARVSGIADAARGFASRARDPAAELMASALATSERLGSRSLSEVLDALAEASVAEAAVVREARARQTRSRLSARIVAGVPLLLLLAIRGANPAYLEPFSAPTGQAVLAVALGLMWAGYAAMRRAARIEEAPA